MNWTARMDAVRTACFWTLAVSLVISGSRCVICSLSSGFKGVLTESILLKQRGVLRHWSVWSALILQLYILKKKKKKKDLANAVGQSQILMTLSGDILCYLKSHYKLSMETTKKTVLERWVSLITQMKDNKFTLYNIINVSASSSNRIVIIIGTLFFPRCSEQSLIYLIVVDDCIHQYTKRVIWIRSGFWDLN